jgi:hypothetical protein
MDAERFDRMVKRLRSGTTRRGLLAGVAAVPLALGARRQVAAKEQIKVCKECKKVCKSIEDREACVDCYFTSCVPA